MRILDYDFEDLLKIKSQCSIEKGCVYISWYLDFWWIIIKLDKYEAPIPKRFNYEDSVDSRGNRFYILTHADILKLQNYTVLTNHRDSSDNIRYILSKDELEKLIYK